MMWNAEIHSHLLCQADYPNGDRENYSGVSKKNVKENVRQSVALYEKAANFGYAPSQVAIGIYCEEYTSSLEAEMWFKKAAQQGNVDAMFCLGQLYRIGHGMRLDKKKSMEWYRKAALAGDLDARVPFVWEALNGDNDAYDFLMSLPGFADFEYEVGMLYNFDYKAPVVGRKLRFKESIRKSIQHLKISAERSNNPEAMYELGLIYEEGDHHEILFKVTDHTLRNKNKARKYYEMAASQGHEAAKRALKDL